MRYLILSDIHSNLPALLAVLELVEGKYDQFVCLGDIVGYGPHPNEVIDRVQGLDAVAVVRGNHDKACCGITEAEDFTANARAAATWTRQQLDPENLSYLRGLDIGPVPVGGFQIVHGSVRHEDEYVFHPREARESLLLAKVPLTFCGHTHIQGGFVLRGEDRVQVLKVGMAPGPASATLELDPAARYLINPGSIGQPRDGDPRAGFAYYTEESRLVEYWRVPYDVQSTQKKMKEVGLPGALIDRLAIGR